MRNFARSIGGGLLTAFLMAGCEAPDGTRAGSTTEPASAVESAEPAPGPTAAATPPSENLVASLAGEWRVAGIDGRSFDEPHGLALSGDNGNLWWEPKCAAMWRTYRIDGARIDFGLPAHFRQRDGSTPPVCAIGLPPRLDEVFRALDSADTVTRTPANGILISGGGHSVTLFSQ